MEAARDTKKKRILAVTSSAGGGVGLTDDLVIDILSRVPVKSICRFKCVSPSWRNLISHPDNRKKLPHTVTGFFYFDEFDSCIFVSLAEPPPPRTGRGWVRPPSPSDFLPANTGGRVVDCCNGLVLLNNSRNSGSGSGSDPRARYVTRRVIPVPRSGEVQFVGHSQGRLFYANRDARNASKLSIYVLGEGENGRWTLKHCVDTSGMFAGEEYLQSGLLVGVAAIHPHGDSILFDSLQGRLMSYGMGSRRGHLVHSVEESPLWSFVPYVPLYLETAALENSN
uniref:F-box domain-containing protein n=1 Tax=Saccharum hybrid cultivar R570 TaxID=131158 RepID=A0A059PZ67_9POAL|nr:hypothetical protein SHCRBa_020_A05_F_120 [Saccharum hybrid cultivar R570]